MRHGLCVLGRKRRARAMNAGVEDTFWQDMPRKGYFVGVLRAFGAARSLFFSDGLGLFVLRDFVTCGFPFDGRALRCFVSSEARFACRLI